MTLIGWVLDRSFRDSVVAGAEEQLRLVIYSLMGSVDEEEQKLIFNDDLFEPRLSQPDSGLYARVSSDIDETLWLSTSASTTAVEFPQENVQPGSFLFRAVNTPIPRYHLSYMVFWEGVDTEQVVFAAAIDQKPYRRAITQFRQSLGLGFGAATLVFVIAQLLALRWGLRPLRTMAGEVQELEAGERERLSDAYPKELDGLAGNLDRFVAHEERSRTRYRNALEDLAHSLKTPLAVVRNSLLDEQPDKTLLTEQLDRMQTTVTHQLSKASATGPVVVGKNVQISDMVERLIRALQTAYIDRGIEVTLHLQEDVQAKGDERDFMEIVGNLLENAFKYTASKVEVRTFQENADGQSFGCLEILDDGPGIPSALRAEVLNRGLRLDEIENGQGIGMSVVAELVALYEGSLSIDDGLPSAVEQVVSGTGVLVRLPG